VVPNYLNMTYNYSATQNNGRITSSVDGVTGENTTYTYDALNRLTAASNSLWSQTYTYDGFGNLLTKSLANGSPNPSPAVSVSYNANNQQTGYNAPTYDSNGNQTYANGTWYWYSVENRLAEEANQIYQTSYIYAYDPRGKRVMSSNEQGNYIYTFYGITGQPLATLNCNISDYPAYPSCWIAGQNVYYGKKLIVSGGVPVVTDRLGSVRADTQGESMAYYPFGEERTGTPDGRAKFGTYFRDMIGQDYADQRYYGSGIGRFWSPDRGTASLGNPMTWNRYAYAAGDPVNRFDPTGKNVAAPADGGCTFVGVDDDGLLVYDCNQTGGGGGGAPYTFSTDVTSGTAEGTTTDPSPEPPDPTADPPEPPDPPVSPSGPSPDPGPSPCPRNIRNFFNVVIPIANQLASSLSTDANYILALSAYESGWLGQHAQDLHNLFGLTRGGGRDLNFSSYQASANYWAKIDGPHIDGDASIAAFSQDIQPYYNTVNPAWTQTLVNVFNSVLAWRVKCDQ
jgi:RHS repeat-associated protein